MISKKSSRRVNNDNINEKYNGNITEGISKITLIGKYHIIYFKIQKEMDC
jgi:hypothetical protein